MIRVLLVHDTYLLRAALAACIGREPDLEVSSASWQRAVTTSRTQLPDVCVVDMDSHDPEGSRVLRELSARCCVGGGTSALLALASAERPGTLRRAFEERALGYLSKNASPDRLVEGIRRVAKGEQYIDESLGFGFLAASEIPLTKRELSVLSLAAEGASIGEIARSLHLSNGTVRNYLAAITRKTGARNRVDAIRISRGAGWV
ncbi:response regulator transcription factor [Streptomyces sp. ISL-11]|uniref:response regulator transcription factor n=1 Tax=Streptomyces sp. ISL-11 TaxID=2819174 RepID=UPI001BEAD5C9|nr:response regulator transcription factor [Streptomyces sp. ISL-11]MBT2387180.1 response regulator transcription factor [Streptomyces sp. ISL-11]